MSKVSIKLDDIKEVQKTIDTLLSEKEIFMRNGTCLNSNSWSIKEMYSGDECNFGFAYSDDKGEFSFPSHVHMDSIEYLICVRGRVLLNILDMATRILNVGDCAAVPKNVVHNTTPLEPASILVYVCVPPDGTFSTQQRHNSKVLA